MAVSRHVNLRCVLKTFQAGVVHPRSTPGSTSSILQAGFVSQKVLYPSGPTTQARSHQNTRLLSLSGLKCTRDFPFCRTTGLLSAATVWSDKRTAPDVFQPARGHWSLGGGRGDRTDQNCHPIPSPLVYAGASCIIHLFPHKASNRPGAIKSHGKDVVHFISFFFLISCRIQSPRPQSPPHPPQT